MGGFEGPQTNEDEPENVIHVDFNAEPKDEIVVIRDAPQPEGITEEVFDIEKAKSETPFEILGRMGVINQEITRLRDSISGMPANMIEDAKKEMGYLVKTYNQLDTLHKLKERGGDVSEINYIKDEGERRAA